MFFKQRPFPEFFLLIIIVAVINWFAVENFWYWLVKDLDSFMHFLGGASVSLAFVWLYFFSGIFAPKKRRIIDFFVISMLGTVFVSVLWEIYEIKTGTTGASIKEYPFDTSVDFVMDILGGIATCFYGYLIELKHLDRIAIQNNQIKNNG